MIRAGVIGLGWKGWRIDSGDLRPKPQSHVGAYLMTQGVELVAVCDIDKAKLNVVGKHIPHVALYEDPERMLSESKLDIVSVVTPVESHAWIVELAARYVPIIFCEKPIADTVSKAESMIATCKEHGTVLAVNHERRWHTAWINAHDYLKEIGKVTHVVGFCSGDPVDAGIHIADLFLWFGPEAPFDYINLMIEEKYKPYLVFELDVFGEKGRIRITDNGRTVMMYKSKPSKHYTGINELKFTDYVIIGRIPEEPIQTPMLCAVKNLVDCFLGKAKPAVTGEDGLKALKLCLRWKK